MKRKKEKKKTQFDRKLSMNEDWETHAFSPRLLKYSDGF